MVLANVLPLSSAPTKVLLVRVSVVFCPTSVSVAAGKVRIPEATGDARTVVKPEIEPGSVNWVNPTAAVTTGLAVMGTTVEISSVPDVPGVGPLRAWTGVSGPALPFRYGCIPYQTAVN